MSREPTSDRGLARLVTIVNKNARLLNGWKPPRKWCSKVLVLEALTVAGG